MNRIVFPKKFFCFFNFIYKYLKYLFVKDNNKKKDNNKDNN